MVLLCEYRAFPLVLEPTPAAAPPVYEWLADFDFPGAVVEWPFGLFYDFDYVFRQSAHGKPILNGYSGFFPATYTGLEAQVKQRPIPDSVWETMGNLGASMLVYHAHDGSGYRVVGYADALDRALSEGRLELVRSFPHGKGSGLRFDVPGDARGRSGRDAGAPRRPGDPAALRGAVADLRRNVVRLAAPVRRHPPAAGRPEGRSRILGPRLGARRLRDCRGPLRGGAGAFGFAVVAGAWPGVSEAYPDYPDAASRSSYGFPLPELPDGPHTLRVTFVGRDGGATTLERAIVVTHRAPARSAAAK